MALTPALRSAAAAQHLTRVTLVGAKAPRYSFIIINNWGDGLSPNKHKHLIPI